MTGNSPPAAPEAQDRSSVQTVSAQLHDGVTIIKIDNPPVNAISVDVRRGLLAAIETADADGHTRAILIVGAGRAFIAGADIREFGQPAVPPTFQLVCNRIESCTKPVIAAIHGPALGGGLEVAMAAHYRLAMPDAQLGLPEVQLGLMPGAGGTQRAPRLMGVRAAVEMMLSGRKLGAKEGVSSGLIDRLGAGKDVVAEGLAYVHDLLKAGAGPRRTREVKGDFEDPSACRATLEQFRIETTKKGPGLFSPFKVIEAVAAGIDRSFDAALEAERELFLACVASPQRASLIHLFLAEREAARVPEARTSSPRPIASVGVVGGGIMGSGIAVAMLNAGLPVVMVERDEASVASGRANVEKVYSASVAKGRMTTEAMQAVMGRFTAHASYSALSEADLVIDAVYEDLDLKKQVFVELDRVAKKGAILATNTSCLDVGDIAEATSRPQDVIGLHFLSPAHIMRLLEIVVPPRVAPDVIVTAFEFAKKLKKISVRAGVCDGFIGNRVLTACRSAADHMLEDGASPYQIDQAIREFGYPMGPYQVADLAGGDIGWATRKRRAPTRDPRARYVQIPDRLCEQGWFGQKTSRGYYRYAQGSRAGAPDPEVLSLIETERVRARIVPREFDADEIVRRYLAAMINEAADVVHQRIALRPLDVDVTMVNGYGFPRHKGGPMKFADEFGLDRVLADIHQFAKTDPIFWQASPLIVDLVGQGRNFESLNREAKA